MSNVAIKVSHLTKVYKLYDKPVDRLKESLNPLKKKYHKEFYALNDVSFEIKKGETVGIIGKNGAGKSTLLKIITGVLTPSSGHVHVNGRIASLLELGAGFNPEYTGLENIYLQGTLMGYTKEEMDSKIDEILAFADIQDFVYQPVKMYSSGMFARLAFAISVNVQPDILIVDEALSVGDAPFVNKCYKKINDFVKNGMTLLFVSHSVDTVVSLCNRALLIENGICIMNDSAEKVINTYNKRNRIQNKDQKNYEFNSDKSNFIVKEEQFIINEQFIKKHKDSRYGSGDAQVVDVSIIHGTDFLKRQFIFGTRIKLKIYIETINSINFLNCGYFIKTDKGIPVIGGNFETLKTPLLNISSNKRIIVEFDICLNLKSGIYSITVALGGKDINSNEYIVDWIDLAEAFEIYHSTNQYSFEYLVHIPSETLIYEVN